MSCATYLLISHGFPRDHHAIFVTTHQPERDHGNLFQVSGNMQSGMHYNHRHSEHPETSPHYVLAEKIFIGDIVAERFDDVQGVIEKVEPPIKQFDGPRRLVKEGEVRRCQEWTREAIALLREEGILGKN